MKKIKIKQILAIIAIIILVLMYVLSLVFALLKVPNWQRMFFASMALTVILPMMLWWIIWGINKITGDGNLQEGEEEISHRKHNS